MQSQVPGILALCSLGLLLQPNCSAVAAQLSPSPPAVTLEGASAPQIDLGKSLFETQWINSGDPGVGVRVGLGPLFNAASCNTCHFRGGHGQGPIGDGPTPVALVIQLESQGRDSVGDPTYGRVFTTSAAAGVKREGRIEVRYNEIRGYYYPFGPQWSMRVPHYSLTNLNYGPLAPNTVIKPRLAPPLFGVDLLEAVPEATIAAGKHGAPAWQTWQGRRILGRFGWQGSAISIRDQTLLALVHEMGITSRDRLNDDCTTAQAECRGQRADSAPKISEEFVDALVAYQRTFTVPLAPQQPDKNTLGARLFTDVGCAACHRPRLGEAAAYTDLRLHNLGPDMADENAAGEKVMSQWRTAPLWGLSYRMKNEVNPTFMHDGRARTTEEAVLWHSGEASRARFRFERLGPNARDALLKWIEAL